MSIVDYAELAKARFDHATHRLALAEKIETQLCIVHNGGMFKATPDLISFLWSWPDDELVLKDLHNNPIKCNRKELETALREAYRYAMNAWLIEFDESKKVRKLTDV
jgi:hypothetical protein